MALNGGKQFEYTDAISFLIDCADQAEVDRLWETLPDRFKKKSGRRVGRAPGRSFLEQTCERNQQRSPHGQTDLRQSARC